MEGNAGRSARNASNAAFTGLATVPLRDSSTSQCKTLVGPPEALGTVEDGSLEGTRLGSQSDSRHPSQPVLALEFLKASLVDFRLVQQSPVGRAEARCRLVPSSERDGAGVVGVINFIMDQR